MYSNTHSANTTNTPPIGAWFGTGDIYPREVQFGTGQANPIKSLDVMPQVLEYMRITSRRENPVVQHTPDVRAPLEHLNNIRTVLHLSIAEIAHVCDVSRQAVYKWLSQDAKPEPDNIKYICTLSYVADEFKKAGVIRSGSLLTVKAFKDLSLIDLIKAGKPHDECLKALIKEARSMEDAYNNSGLASSQRKPTKDWRSAFAGPAYREDYED